MFLSKIKKSIAVILISGIIVGGGAYNSFALEPSDEVTEKVESNQNSNLTIAEIEQIFQKYLDDNNINIKIGTPEYLDYIYSQMLESKDKTLEQHPDHDLIYAYFAEYIVTAQNEALQKEKQKEKDTKDTLSIDDVENKDKTIPEIREEALIEEKKVEAEGKRNEDINKRVRRSAGAKLRGYNPSEAVRYAHRWANSFNPKYANYDGKGGDCTNFVSQCIKAGGGRETKSPARHVPIVPTTSYWWCNFPIDVSSSWIRVKDFHSYWAPKIPDANYKDAATVGRNGYVGDVVQIRYAGTLTRWHTMIITKKVGNKVYLSGHSKARYDYSISNIDDKKNDWSLLDF